MTKYPSSYPNNYLPCATPSTKTGSKSFNFCHSDGCN